MQVTGEISKFDFPWEVLSTLVEGESPIDLRAMVLQDEAEAEKFLFHYGYDACHLRDRQELHQIFQEALIFLERRLLDATVDWVGQGEPPSPAERVPAHVVGEGNLVQLLLLAANGSGSDRDWACALLKVMHTLVHVRHSPVFLYLEEARKQIFARFEAVLTAEESHKVFFLGDAQNDRRLKLVGFEMKSQKPMDSILIKLLCKKESVAEDVWDMLGVRLVTHTPAEVLLALDILRQEKVILFSNIIPSRCRNTLLDLGTFRQAFHETMAEHPPESWKALVALLQSIPVAPREGNYQEAYNPASSKAYRSVHVTARQLIRIPVEGVNQPPKRFFMPYEIQLMDRANYVESKVGSSAHSQYKWRQLAQARRRVLGPLLEGFSGSEKQAE